MNQNQFPALFSIWTVLGLSLALTVVLIGRLRANPKRERATVLHAFAEVMVVVVSIVLAVLVVVHLSIALR
jgi:flagellar motor component MotA